MTLKSQGSLPSPEQTGEFSPVGPAYSPASPFPEPDRPRLSDTQLFARDIDGKYPREMEDFDLTSLPVGAPRAAGRSILEKEIARGGMGVIIRGRDIDFEREVAVKVLHAAHSSNEHLRERFRKEARLTSRLQHPGIVSVYELGEFPDGRPFFTMRLVDGQTLKSLLAQRTRSDQDLPRFLKVFEQVCQTLAYAHAHGVIHRDLKPSNVMVAPFGVVKVLDWGIAKVLSANRSLPDARESRRDANDPGLLKRALEEDSVDESDSMTRVGSVLGTLEYMAPEQALGDVGHIDERIDVFGLGAILCEILTSRPPYCEPNAVKLYDRVAKAELDEVYARLEGCFAERELVALAKACLAKNPADRPRSAVEVVRSLTAYFESDLRRAERDMVRFFELSPDLFCLASMDGFFRRVNSNFSRILGYSFEELVSRPFIDFVHRDDREATMAEVAKLAVGLPCVRFRNRYRDVRNDYHQFEWMAKSIPEEQLIFAVARDVTEKSEC